MTGHTTLSSLMDGLPLLVFPSYAYAAYTDINSRIIKNEVSLFLLALFLACQMGEYHAFNLSRHLIWGGITLVLLFPFYAWGKLGAGDVKLIAVTTLWLGPVQGIPFLISTAFFGGIFAMMILAYPIRWGWEYAQQATSGYIKLPDFPDPHAIPYGLPISLAACVSFIKSPWV